jgi:hypothetical protein
MNNLRRDSDRNIAAREDTLVRLRPFPHPPPNKTGAMLATPSGVVFSRSVSQRVAVIAGSKANGFVPTVPGGG